MTDPAAVLENLQREDRAGVPHFRTGQHQAWLDSEDPRAAVLLYVDVMGWAVILGCQRECSWEAVAVFGRVSATGVAQAARDLPADFALSDEMRAALAAAERDAEARL